MSIPNWYELILLSLAAWRVFQLIALDDITDGLRRYVTRRLASEARRLNPKAKRETLPLFIECPYCAGFWIALAWWGAFQMHEFGTLVSAVPFALSVLAWSLARRFYPASDVELARAIKETSMACGGCAKRKAAREAARAEKAARLEAQRAQREQQSVQASVSQGK